MLSLPFESVARESRPAARIGRKIAVAHVVTLAVVVLMAIASYAALERSIAIQRESTAALALAQEQQTLSQRIASLIAQYALGNAGVRHELRRTIGAFETAHWRLVAGDRTIGIGSAIADPHLKQLYFAGSAPLDAAATDYAARARRIVALPVGDPSLAAHTAPIFLAAAEPLLDGLAAAQLVRRTAAARQLLELRIVGAFTCMSTMLALLASVLLVFRPMVQRIAELERDARELAEHVTTDPLTGMLNKRSFQDRGAIEIQKARRYDRPLSLLRIDADQLGAIEAAYGPDGGETVLKALTTSFFSGTRVSDLVARVDTEQFAILLPETSAEGAQLLAERLRRKISGLTFPIADQLVSCTISVGVAVAEKDATFLWPTFKRADEAVYEAKAQGRNRVVVSAIS